MFLACILAAREGVLGLRTLEDNIYFRIVQASAASQGVTIRKIESGLGCIQGIACAI
jgi:hypothetical protein